MTARSHTTASIAGITARAVRLACVAAAVLAGAMLLPREAAAQVVAMVNGLPITALDIEQREKLERLSGQKPISRDQAFKLLVDDRLKISVAKRYGLELSDAEVNSSFGEIAARSRQTPEQFEQVLLRQGISASALKSRIRADVVWQQLIRGKFGASLQVSEGELANAMVKQNDGKDDVGYIYTLRPVVVVVPRGSGEAVLEAKRREADSVRSRFQGCNEGLAMVRGMRDVVVRDIVRRNSADVSAQLREMLGKLEIGRLSPPEPTPQGLQMFALCDKRQSNSDTPEKRDLKEKIYNERYQREAKKFLEEVRRQAMIEYRR